VRFLVVSRPGHDYPAPAEARVERLDELGLRISSSAIRTALGQGREPEGVPPAVLRYIRERGLYGTGGG
jgi:nicotinic acid mononucleotide adenylyltransferase